MKKLTIMFAFLFSMGLVVPYAVSPAPVACAAQAQAVAAEGAYEMSLEEGFGESLKTAKIRARLEALRAASEQAGVYVAASSVVRDGTLSSDDVRMIASAVLRVKEESYATNAMGGKGMRVTCRIRAEVTEAAIDRALFERDKDLQQWNQMQAQNRALAEEVARVREENEALRAAYRAAQDPKERKRLAGQALRNQHAVQALDYVTRGNAHLDLEQYGAAVADYTEAVRLDPELLLAYTNRGVAYAKNQQWDNAVYDFSYVLRKQPENTEALASRAYLLTFDAAIWDFDELIRRRPDDAAAYNGRGKAYVSIGKKQQALADYDKAIALAPDFLLAYINRAQLCYTLGDYAASYRDATQAKALLGRLENRRLSKWDEAYAAKWRQSIGIDELLRDLAVKHGYR